MKRTAIAVALMAVAGSAHAQLYSPKETIYGCANPTLLEAMDADLHKTKRLTDGEFDYVDQHGHCTFGIPGMILRVERREGDIALMKWENGPAVGHGDFPLSSPNGTIGGRAWFYLRELTEVSR